jgi:hypothetical protein
MEVYVLRNEDGTQSFSKEINDSDTIVGVWKLKSINYNFIYSLTSKIEYNGNPQFKERKQSQLAFFLTYYYNCYKRRNRKNLFEEVVKNKKYLSVIKHIASMSRLNDYISIQSILKHFEQTDTPIDKQVLLDMVKEKLLNKSYHKVNINKNGFEYLKK